MFLLIAALAVRLLAAIRPPAHPVWGKPRLPIPSWRNGQVEALEEITEHYAHGIDLVLVDAPTGVGKTWIGEGARRLVNPAGRTTTLASTKVLQRQYKSELPWGAVLMGKANYPTLDHPDRFDDRWDPISADDCTRTKDKACSFCTPNDACPFRVAKAEALAAPLALLNYSAFLAYANLTRPGWPTDLVVADEADLIESELMTFVEFELSATLRRRIGLGVIERGGITKPEAWVGYLEEAQGRIERHLATLTNSTKDRRIRRTMNRQKEKCRAVRTSIERMLAGDGGGWVYTGSLKSTARDAVAFKPIEVHAYGNEVLWSHSRRWLLMSATLISADVVVEELGWDRPFAVVSLGSPFPIANRPVYVAPVADMSFKTEAADSPKMALAIANVARLHPDERILVHAVSYPRAQWIVSQLARLAPGRPVYTYSKPNERDAALTNYRNRPGAILVAPSFERGVDLPDDLCRVMVVAKIPYPSTQDAQVKERIRPNNRAGQVWYATETVRSLVQMTGRGVRHANDRAVTYILDASFMSNTWRRHRNLLPRWWREALDWGFPIRELLAPIPGRPEAEPIRRPGPSGSPRPAATSGAGTGTHWVSRRRRT